ncbi:acyltransferase family protein [Pantoea eucrina]|uniref:acyltransferase family protein n=1 Tax=Pantoea eucrina TaxID=472693 RepID=UPI00301C54DD
MASSAGERIEWVDTLKVLGIFYIYLGHFGKNAGYLHPFVFLFHVPLFFFISGLFARNVSSFSDARSTVIKSAKSILVPYFIFGFISLLIYSFKGNLDSHTTLMQVKSLIFAIRNNIFATSLWFLPCLFVVIVYYCIAKLVLKKDAYVFLLSLILYFIAGQFSIASHPSLPWNIDSAIYYFVFYTIGSLASPLIRKGVNISTQKWSNPLLLLVCSLSVAFTIYSFYKPYGIYASMSSTFLRNMTSLVATVALFIPQILLANVIRFKFLSEIGKSTVVFCGTEQATKIVVVSFFSMIGCNISLKSPLDAVIFSGICVVASYYLFAMPYNNIKNRKTNNLAGR